MWHKGFYQLQTGGGILAAKGLFLAAGMIFLVSFPFLRYLA